jgi:hypothetical protein
MAPATKKRDIVVESANENDFKDLKATENGNDDEDNDSNTNDHHRDKKKRKTNKSNEKELTAQDIQELRETEELFKNNLFRWQLDELLKRSQINYDKCGPLEKAFWKLKELLESMPAVEEMEASCVYVI